MRSDTLILRTNGLEGMDQRVAKIVGLLLFAVFVWGVLVVPAGAGKILLDEEGTVKFVPGPTHPPPTPTPTLPPPPKPLPQKPLPPPPRGHPPPPPPPRTIPTVQMTDLPTLSPTLTIPTRAPAPMPTTLPLTVEETAAEIPRVAMAEPEPTQAGSWVLGGMGAAGAVFVLGMGKRKRG